MKGRKHKKKVGETGFEPVFPGNEPVNLTINLLTLKKCPLQLNKK